MKEQTENNSNMDMKNLLCPLRRLSPTAPANSPTAKMLLPQTHSRSRAMLTSITKIALPSCLWMFFFLFHLHSSSHATCTSILVEKQHYDVHADLQMLYHSVIS